MNDTRIAIYIRLSLADEETGKEKDESNSIIHQRMLINHYLDNHSELSQCPRTEFVDDGFSGTNMDRPSFQKMIAGIKEGRYNLCITKDFSRFARDYIEMGNYLECLFPFLRVRYISINDGYDSHNYKGTTGGLEVVMRSIVYAAYSRDLSQKVTTAKNLNMKKGRRTSGHPAYGYMPDPDRKGYDIIDPETAPVVRRIFDEALKGKSIADITKMLNDEHIPTPREMHKKKYKDSKKYSHTDGMQYWQTSTVKMILQRLSYTGAFVGGIRRAVAPCSKKYEHKERKDWVVVEDMHPAIVTQEEYDAVQAMFQTAYKKFDNIPKEIYPLKGVIHCGCCGRVMYRDSRYNRFYCRAVKRAKEKWKRRCEHTKENVIEQAVLETIQRYYNSIRDKQDIHNSHGSKVRDNAYSIERLKKISLELMRIIVRELSAKPNI